MKPTAIVLLALIVMTGCHQNGSVTPPAVRITATSHMPGPVTIGELQQEATHELLVTPDKETHFTPDITRRTLYMASLPGKPYKIALSLGVDEIIDLKLADDYSMGFRVSGSAETERLSRFNKAMYRAEQEMQHFMQRLNDQKEAFSTIREEALQRMKTSRDSLQELGITLIEEDPGALANTLLLQQYFGQEHLFPVRQFPELYRNVLQHLNKNQIKNGHVLSFIETTNETLRSIKQLEEARQNTSAGNTAPDIRLAGPKGETVSLHEEINNHTVLIFWSFNDENIQELFKKIDVMQQETQSSSSFEVFAVSLHPNQRLWSQTAAALPQWYHVSEPQGIEASSAKQYGLMNTPTFLLISPQKEILLRTSNHKMLVEKLAKLSR